MKTLIIIQARSNSSRFPGKVFMPLAGKPLLVRMVERVLASSVADMTVVATTTEPVDDRIVELCQQHSITCFRGHPTDLLDRHYMAAVEFDADVIVKIPSDCPLIDPIVIDRVIEYFIAHHKEYDFVSNLHPASYPDGNDVEVMPINVLKEAWLEATKDYEREHTTPFIWEQPHRYRIGNVSSQSKINYSMTHRFTIDYREDYEFIRQVYEQLYTEDRIFLLEDILALLERKPEIYTVNKQYAGVNWYRHHLDELKTITRQETKTIF